MKNITMITMFLAILLGGCDKLSEGGDSLKEKLSWIYTEETDKLNNIKIQKVKRDFKNPEGVVQADVEFQCRSGKELTLKISSFQTKADKGTLPGAALMFKTPSSMLKGVYFVKTRNGDSKLVFPVISQNVYSNVAEISLKGMSFNRAEISAITNFVNIELSMLDPGYKIAIDGNEIQKSFKSNEWTIEIPTEVGVVTPTIDMSHKNIQKVFEACAWTPDFLSAKTPPASQSQDGIETKVVALEKKESATRSHCKSDEHVQFTAEMGKFNSGKFTSNNKILSLCSDQNLTSYIEYRYGVIGSPEIIISAPKEGQVIYETTANDPKSSNTELTFIKGNYKYTVSTCSGMTCDENISSLTVFNGDKQLTQLIASNEGLVTKLFDNSFETKNPNNKLFKKR